MIGSKLRTPVYTYIIVLSYRSRYSARAYRVNIKLRNYVQPNGPHDVPRTECSEILISIQRLLRSVFGAADGEQNGFSAGRATTLSPRLLSESFSFVGKTKAPLQSGAAPPAPPFNLFVAYAPLPGTLAERPLGLDGKMFPCSRARKLPVRPCFSIKFDARRDLRPREELRTTSVGNKNPEFLDGCFDSFRLDRVSK